ncbi:MAG TPA: VOC family protein [Acidimicrobiales bacterium]|nr:VOC family protein [Acidimicrobiales bacterium]
MATVFSHFGICVSDLDRSVRFYCEGLGFERAESHSVGEEFDRLVEIDGVRLRSQFVRTDGVALELLHFDAPGQSGDARRRALNQLGLTHLSVRVDDIDEVATLIESLGGSLIPETRTTFDLGESTLDFVYCTDPDGVRVELMKVPAFPGD